MKRFTINAFIFAIAFISQSSFSAAPAAKTLPDSKAEAALTEQLKIRQEQAQKYAPLIAEIHNALDTTDSSIKVLVLKIVNREQLNGALRINQAFGKNEQTLLMAAIALENFSLLKLVLAYQPNVNQADIRGNTALHYAGLCGVDPNMTAQLLQAGALPTVTNKEGQTPLMMAAGFKWWKVQDLTHYHATLTGIALAVKKIDQKAIDTVNKQDISALIIAILHYNFHTVDTLLNNGADAYKFCRGHRALNHALAVKKLGNKNLAEEPKLTEELKKQAIEAIVKRLKEVSKDSPLKAQSAAAGSDAQTADHKLALENAKKEKRKVKLKAQQQLSKPKLAFKPRGKSHAAAANPPAQKPAQPQESTIAAAKAVAAAQALAAAKVQFDEQKKKSEEATKDAAHNSATAAAQKAPEVNKEDLITAALAQIESLNLEFDSVIESGSRQAQEKMKLAYFKAINTLNRYKYQDDAKAELQHKKLAYSRHNQLHRLINGINK